LKISLHDFICCETFQWINLITDTEGKWNIKEIIQHVIDTERIFGYRACEFLPETIKPHCCGFDENYY
jgi:hypothetical protein